MPDLNTDESKQSGSPDSLLGKLTNRERLILELRFGLSGYEPHTLHQVASVLGWSASSVSRWESAALNKLGRPQSPEEIQRIFQRELESQAATTPPSFGSIYPADRVVLVLGAGASISEMQEGKARTLPPTDADFLRRAYDCVPDLYADLQQAFNRVWAGAEPYPLKHQRMEQLFSSCFLKVLQTSGSSRNGRAARILYDTLVELLRDTLSVTTNRSASTQHLALLKSLHNANPRSINVVSFNYDVLADRALLAGSRAGHWRWSHADGYGFRPANQRLPRAQSEIQLLKLHGSMNWYVPTPGRTRASAYNENAPIYVPNPGASSTSPPWQRRQHTLGHSAVRVFPLLVPPVFEKGSQINGVLQQVWNQAHALLREATLVIVWGYSLPTTDYHAEVLFAQSARRARFRLMVINPDRAALGRVTGVAGHTWSRWFFKAKHFFDLMEGRKSP